jgi:ATP-dependent DNA helicase DinG
VSEDEARARLKQLVGAGAEDRSQQSDYSAFMAQAFAPLPGDNEDAPPQAVIAEAGTGVGKTLGYLAPASVWAEKNKGSVWISTYTKNLQRQIDQELSKLYPDKGREGFKSRG